MFRVYWLFALLLGLCLAIETLDLSSAEGILVMFENNDSVEDPIMTDIVSNYAQFVEKELQNTVKYEYNSAFYGIAVELNNKHHLYQKIISALGFEEMRIDDDKLVTKGLYKVFYDHEDVKTQGISIVILLDSLVKTNGI